MRIGFISHWYDPEGGAAAGPGTIARALQQRGHQVDVVTGYPIYPTGRVADGYRIRPYQREVREGVTVHRAPIYPSHDTRAGHRMANYLSFAVSGSLVAAAALRKCDVLYVYSTPATASIPSLGISAVRRIPTVVHVQDLWPQTVTSSGFVEATRGTESRMEKVLHRYCDLVYRQASRIAVTSPGMTGLITERRVPRDKIEFVPNWAEERSFRPEPKDPEFASAIGLKAPFTVMYAGNLGEMQQLDIVLDAAAMLVDETGLEIALVGGGVMANHLARRIESEQLRNVRLIDPQPFTKMSAVLALGDVQLITLKDLPLYRSTLPSKLQATLAAGRPIIGALAGDAAAVVEGSGAGVVSSPGDAVALADAIRSMRAVGNQGLAEMGRAGRAHYELTYSERAVGDRLESLLHAAVVDGK